ncbi:glycerol kinase [Anastrepha obliqua]|uniref:glycerol kinase n=1 Tax=Anastrepha obliqua TaxID=95512 RepID=UPI0024090634|nr:glycerol kinase [Anastrepha obliqua]
MASPSFGNFGPLIGVIYVNSTYCRFLIYSTKNAEVLTFHEVKLRQIVHNAGWLEYDPEEIWKNTQECIETAYKNLIILEINPYDLIAIGICSQRGTTILWDKETGGSLYNALGWSDCRTSPLLKTMLGNVNYDVNYLRHKSGLPLSTCFSALKIKWLQENVAAVSTAMEKGTCLFGTLDSWILWNLTGSNISGVHSTDVTNAGYTSLMNVHTLQWDVKLCNFFRIPLQILPRIRSNSELYGYVIGGALNGLPIAACIGEQSAALLGQLQTKVGQNVCIIDDSCFVLLNTGEELIESSHGLLSLAAYKLGPKVPTFYSLEGAISNAGATVNWLKKGLRISTEINSNDNVVEVLNTFLGESSMISSSCSSGMLNAECGLAAKRSEITFVPAFHGLYAPYWRYDARGIMLGLTSLTTAEHVTQAAYEATGFQIHEILDAFKKDTPTWNRKSTKERLILGGDYAENNAFVQFIADIVGCLLEKPQTTSPAGLGTMICAGITMKVVSLLQAEVMYPPPVDAFSPTTTANRREQLYKRWNYAVQKCLNWNNFATYEEDLELFAQRDSDPNLPIRRSLPGSIYITSSFLLLLVANFLHGRNIV